MKSLISICLLIIASASAFAGSENPIRTVADVTTTGGFVQVAMSFGIKILSNGSVVSFSIKNGTETDTQMATLTDAKLSEVISAVDLLKQAPLQEPPMSGCMDAPDTTWNAYSSAGQVITLHKYDRCQDWPSKNSNSLIKKLLDGFLALSNLN